MDRLQNIETFVCVAECQSFTEAARRMRVSRSVVSERIQQLEQFLGRPLFHRTTRSVRLSDLGQAFLNDCTALIGRATDIMDQMQDVGGTPSGQLRIHAVPGIVLNHLPHVLHEFQTRYPEIQLEVTMSDTIVDPVRSGYDCALQIFKPASEQLVARTIFMIERAFCASPAYLARHGTPRHPREFADHKLGLYSGYPTGDRWSFRRGDEAVVLRLRASLLTNSVHLLAQQAQEDTAIVCLPALIADELVAGKKLRYVLQDFKLAPLPLLAVYPRTLRRAYKLRLFLDMLTASFDRLRRPERPRRAK